MSTDKTPSDVPTTPPRRPTRPGPAASTDPEPTPEPSETPGPAHGDRPQPTRSPTRPGPAHGADPGARRRGDPGPARIHPGAGRPPSTSTSPIGVALHPPPSPTRSPPTRRPPTGTCTTARSSQAPVEQAPVEAPRRRLRVGTVVWGLVIAAIGVGLLAWAAGFSIDVQLAIIVLLAVAGTALLVVGSILSGARNARRSDMTTSEQPGPCDPRLLGRRRARRPRPAAARRAAAMQAAWPVPAAWPVQPVRRAGSRWPGPSSRRFPTPWPVHLRRPRPPSCAAPSR